MENSENSSKFKGRKILLRRFFWDTLYVLLEIADILP